MAIAVRAPQCTPVRAHTCPDAAAATGVLLCVGTQPVGTRAAAHLLGGVQRWVGQVNEPWLQLHQ